MKPRRSYLLSSVPLLVAVALLLFTCTSFAAIVPEHDESKTDLTLLTGEKEKDSRPQGREVVTSTTPSALLPESGNETGRSIIEGVQEFLLSSGITIPTISENSSNPSVVSSEVPPTARNIPEDVPPSVDAPITKCTQKDSAGLNKCLQQVLRELKPRLAEGIPEVNLPPMEPLQLENVAFEQGSGPVRVVSEFTNVEVSGLANFSQSNFWVDVPKRTLDFDLIFPQLTLVGNYELSGNLFFFPIGGRGNFYLNLAGTRAKGASKLGVVRNATEAQVVVKKTDVNLEIESIKVHLTNLFNGDPLLGTVINNFLNENSQEVFEEVKPQIGAQVGELLSVLANRALATLSNQFEDVDDLPFGSEDGDDQK